MNKHISSELSSHALDDWCTKWWGLVEEVRTALMSQESIPYIPKLSLYTEYSLIHSSTRAPTSVICKISLFHPSLSLTIIFSGFTSKPPVIRSHFIRNISFTLFTIRVLWISLQYDPRLTHSTLGRTTSTQSSFSVTRNLSELLGSTTLSSISSSFITPDFWAISLWIW